jgi:hypothetical protein
MMAGEPGFSAFRFSHEVEYASLAMKALIARQSCLYSKLIITWNNCSAQEKPAWYVYTSHETMRGQRVPNVKRSCLDPGRRRLHTG